MKFLPVLGLLLGFSFAVIADNPETIYPKTKLIKPVQYYSTQALLWKDVAMQQHSTADAWLNYYLSSRYAQRDAAELKQILETLGARHQGTFEHYFVASLEAPTLQESFDFIRRAHAINDVNQLAFGPMMLFHEFQLDPENRKRYSEKLFRSNLISSSLLHYSYNVLMSVEQNATLFIDSDNTTIPLFVLQDVLNVRNDVTILNLDLLGEDAYRKGKLNAAGLAFPSDVMSTQELCATIPERNPSHAFYYALTLGKENILSIKDQLYVVGLASQLSTKRMDNISQIRNNLENRFLMDYLTVDFNGENDHAAGKVLSSNYLVPLLLLMDHYKATGDTEKAESLKNQIMNLARQTGKGLLVENFIRGNASEDVPFIPYKLDTKAMEGMFKPIKDRIYAHEYEVTNKQYNEFLKYLKANNRTDLFEVSRHRLEQYQEPALSFMTGYHSDREPTKKTQYSLNYPVVNVTYEGAVAYCDWLTEQYNHNAERKYKKVKFRLPTLSEWQIAAAGIKNPTSWTLAENSVEVKLYEDGKEISKKYETKTVSMGDPEILYPWFRHWTFRNKALNMRGCALGNFKFPENQHTCPRNNKNTSDGFFLMSPVQAYFPNEVGLYDVVGNVAEMISEKGKACGGSWNHPPEESTIRSVIEFSGATSDVGFRVFMEVIEP
jgi:formylglycine-generating enzyme required for sulfatase activity